MDSSSVNAAASSAEKEYLFTAMPVNRAVISLAVPTVISQIITVVYNMADTFFIGQMNDPNQVAAATISMPLFIFMTALVHDRACKPFRHRRRKPDFTQSRHWKQKKSCIMLFILHLDGGRCRFALRNCNTLSSSLFAARNRS